jgi:hypothetical protein
MVELDDMGLHTDPLEERLHLHAISADVEHGWHGISQSDEVRANRS